MTGRRLTLEDPRIQRVLRELEELIRAHFPSATFRVSQGEDPDGFYLDAIFDRDDPDLMMDFVIECLLALQVDEGLPIHVLPLRTREREAQLLASQHREPLIQRRG